MFASARRVEVLEDLGAMGIELIALDVTDLTSIKAAKAEIAARTSGKLDFLVNNAWVSYICYCKIPCATGQGSYRFYVVAKANTPISMRRTIDY